MPFIQLQEFAYLLFLEPVGIDPIQTESTEIISGVPFASSSDQWLMLLSKVDKDGDLNSMLPDG